jgi:hypothetical protein
VPRPELEREAVGASVSVAAMKAVWLVKRVIIVTPIVVDVLLNGNVGINDDPVAVGKWEDQAPDESEYCPVPVVSANIDEEDMTCLLSFLSMEA